jgi:hypothetical protein
MLSLRYKELGVGSTFYVAGELIQSALFSPQIADPKANK